MLANWARTNIGWNVYAPIGMNNDSYEGGYEHVDTLFTAQPINEKGLKIKSVRRLRKKRKQLLYEEEEKCNRGYEKNKAHNQYIDVWPIEINTFKSSAYIFNDKILRRLTPSGNVTYFSMPDLNVDACGLLTLAWIVYGTQTFAELTHDYNLFGQMRKTSNQILKIKQVLFDFMQCSKFKELLASGAIRMVNDFLVEMREDVSRFLPQVSYEEQNLNTEFLFLKRNKLYHAWVQEEFLEDLEQCSFKINNTVISFNEASSFSESVSDTISQEVETQLQPLPVLQQDQFFFVSDSQPGLVIPNLNALGVVDLIAVPDIVEQVFLEQPITEVSFQGISPQIHNVELHNEILIDQAQYNKTGFFQTVFDLAQILICFSSLQTVQVAQPYYVGIPVDQADIQILQVQDEQHQHIIVPTEFDCLKTHVDIEEGDLEDWWQNTGSNQGRIVINGIQKPVSKYYSFNPDLVIVRGLNDVVHLQYRNQTKAFSSVVSNNWMNTYSDASYTLRLGPNIQFVGTHNGSYQILSEPLNHCKLYCTLTRQLITADKKMCDQVQSDYDLTVFTNAKSIQIRINKCVQVHTRSVTSRLSVVLNDCNSELKDTYTRTFYYLNARQANMIMPDAANLAPYPHFWWSGMGRVHTTDWHIQNNWWSQFFGLIYPLIKYSVIGLGCYVAIKYIRDRRARQYLMMPVISNFGDRYRSIGSTAYRTHTSREKFSGILNFNPQILRKFQINLPTRTVKHTQQRPTLTLEDVDLFYDELLTHCSCANQAPRVDYTDIPRMDDNLFVECFTSCPINAVSAIFLRQCAPTLEADPLYQQRYTQLVQQDTVVQTLISSINADGVRPSVVTYLEKVKKTQPSKFKLYLQKYKTLCKQIVLNYQCSVQSKDGEYKFKTPQQIQFEEKEPRSIYAAPEATVIYGGAVSQVITNYMLQFPQFAICRTTDWIQRRVIDMKNKFKAPVFITMDGKRFDSTQHYWMRQAVDNYIYDATALYEKMDMVRSHQDQSKNINCGPDAHYQLFVGKKTNRRVLFSCVIVGTMSSGKNDTSSMNTIRQHSNLNFTDSLCKEQDSGFVMDWMVAGDDVLICLEADMVPIFDMIKRRVYSETLDGVHGIGQCVTEYTIHPANYYMFLSKLGYVDGFSSFFCRQASRVYDLQILTDTLSQGTSSLSLQELQRGLYWSLQHALPNVGLTAGMQTLLPYGNQNDQQYERFMSAYRRYELTFDTACEIRTELYQDLIRIIGEQSDDREYYVDRVESLRGFKRLSDQSQMNLINKWRYTSYDSLVKGLNYWNNSCQWLIPTNMQKIITKIHNNSEKQHAQIASSLDLITGIEQNIQSTQFVVQQTNVVVVDTLQQEVYHAIGSGKDQVRELAEIVRTAKVYFKQTKPNGSHAELIKFIREELPKDLKKLFNPAKVGGGQRQLSKTLKTQGQQPKKRQTFDQLSSRIQQVRQNQIQIKGGTYVKIGSQTGYRAIGMERSKKKTTQLKQNKMGYSKPLNNPFVQSILKPFKTEPIKPYFDYPLNTSIVEQTVEFTIAAVASTASPGVIPVGTYGAVFSVNPHAYNDLQITSSAGAYLSSVAGQPLGNTRFINLFTSGTGSPTDVYQNYSSPLSTYQGTNNTVGARWVSARTIRCGVRVIPTSAQLSRAGYINMVQIPGKDTDISFAQGGYGTSGAVISIPNQTQMRNYPTSYEATNASNQTEHDYVWFPTDLLDAVFMQDNLNMAYYSSGASLAQSGDMETFTNHLRNSIYFVATGLASTDSFRVEVKISYEFVPTTLFRIWADDQAPRATNYDQQLLKEVSINIPTVQADQEEDSIYDKIGGFVVQVARSALGNSLVQDMAMSGLRGLMSTKF